MPAELEDVVSAINSLKTSIEAERTGTSAKTAEELDLENKMLAERRDLLREELAVEEDLEKKAQLRSQLAENLAERVKRSNKTNERKRQILSALDRTMTVQSRVLLAPLQASSVYPEVTKNHLLARF